MNIEMKVKNGAENMIQSISGAHHGRDKKLLAEAQQMLADSKAKIEFLKLRILKVRRNGQSSKVSMTIAIHLLKYLLQNCTKIISVRFDSPIKFRRFDLDF